MLGIVAAVLAAVVPLATPAESSAATTQQSRTYTMYVAAESDDVVEKIAFGPGGFELLKSIPVGIWPTETEGPHGLAISPDGMYWYVTVAHGNPFGLLFKYDTEQDLYQGDVTLGLFPATISISPSTGLLFAVNFNLHGDHVPSTISVVETESMTEVEQIPTGVMPHGSRMNRAGSKHFSVAMMNDELREVDAYRLETSRVLPLSEAAPSWGMDHGGTSGHVGQMAGHEGDAHDAMKPPIIKPTWVTQPTADGKVYVAGNGAATILEVDLESWSITRRFENTGAGPYNLDVSADGRTLVVTYKSDQAIGIWDLELGEETARIETLRPIPHGIVLSPDGRYAFASIEGVGGEPGSVEAYDVQEGRRVGNIDIAKQAGGIVLWKME